MIRPYLLRAALIALCLFSCAAGAQTAPTLSFTVETITGPGTIKPTLKWSTTPAGAVCAATGSWTGAKAASGQIALENITGAQAWTLGCDWNDTGAVLSWVMPTQNSDGTPFANGGLVIWYGQTEGALTEVVTLAKDKAALGTYTFTNLTAGPWFFMIAALSDTGVQGLPSSIVSKTVGGKVTRTVTVTVNPPKAPSAVVVH